MALHAIFEDIASLAQPTDTLADVGNENLTFRVLSSPSDLTAPRGDAAITRVDVGGDIANAVVTADAWLGSTLGIPRLAEIGLLRTLSTNPAATFQFFAIWTTPKLFAEAIRAIDIDAIVPVHLQLQVEYLVVGIGEIGALGALAGKGWNVAALGTPGLPNDHDLFLIRDVSADAELNSLLKEHGAYLLLSSSDGVIIALPAGVSIEQFDFPARHHGHNMRLLPNRSLLVRNATKSEVATAAGARQVAAPDPLVVDAIGSSIIADRIDNLVGQLSGAVPVNGSRIRSRHINHEDAAHALTLVEDEIAALGLSPQRHYFVHEGMPIANLYADIPGSGAGMVWVTAHIDSTASKNAAKFEAEQHSAPGADDDASGTAAVLAIAAALTSLSKSQSPSKTIRFAFFNAEEHGLIGSSYFAIAAANAGLRIDAVLQHDMIGHLKDPKDLRFEVHTGHRPNPEVERLSLPIAQLIGKCATAFGELGDIEIYTTPDHPDHNRIDPADGRSDHTSFHRCGFPAVIISENFFGGPVHQHEPPISNPHYHTSDDTVINSNYTASIARASALAAWTLATDWERTPTP